jgi:hypothetical protein
MAVRKISYKEYCSDICKAKCCYARYEDVAIKPCPQLNEKNLCSIYKERFEENKPYRFTTSLIRNDKLLVLNVHCGKIEEIIKRDQLPQDIKKQCCFYNPKLLEIEENEN